MHPIFNTQTIGFSDNDYSRCTGTFVSSNVVVSCAHAIFVHRSPYLSDFDFSGLNKSISFVPGINNYTGENYYGEYTVTELYASIGYVLKFYEYGYETNYGSGYDWSVCVTNQTTIGSRTHSYMGISGFSYPSSLEYWTHAMSAGYPSMLSFPEDWNLFNRTMWASFPLENNVTIVGDYIDSTSVVVSDGNSGGPMYLKTVGVQYGHVYKNVYLLGITSGAYYDGNNWHFLFYRNTAFIVNVVNQIINAL